MTSLVLTPEPGTTAAQIEEVVAKFRSFGLVAFEDGGQIFVEGDETVIQSALNPVSRVN
jgi:hypothetical protein